MPLGPRLRATAPRTQTRIVLTMLRAVRAARSISLRAAATALAAGTLLLTGACGGDPSPEGGSAGVTAVATTTQVADLVREVGGSRLEVSQILQPNSDPHGYEPRPSDAKAIADADVIFQSGGDLDEWLGDLIDSSGASAPELSIRSP